MSADRLRPARGDHRFLRTRGGITRFARIALEACPSGGWEIALGEGALGIWEQAVRSGLSLAMAAEERRSGQRFRISALCLEETAADTTADAVACAAAIAAWRAFGHPEEVRLEFADGRWSAVLDPGG